MSMTQKQKDLRSKLRRFEAQCRRKSNEVRWYCDHKHIDLGYKTVFVKCKSKNRGQGCSQLCKIKVI